MGLNNLVTVFGCFIVTDSMSKTFYFSTVSSSWVNIFDCVIGFNKLEAVLGYLTVTESLPPFFGVFTVFNALENLLALSIKYNLYISLSLVSK